MRGRWASTGRATRPTRCSNWCRPSARRRCRRSTGWASSTTSSHWSRPATRPPSTLSSCSRYQTHPWFASLSSVSLGLKEFSTNTIFIYLVFVQPSFLPWNRSFHRNGPFFVSTLCYPKVRVFICALLQVLALTVWIFLVKCVRHKCMSNYLHSMVDLKKVEQNSDRVRERDILGPAVSWQVDLHVNKSGKELFDWRTKGVLFWLVCSGFFSSRVGVRARGPVHGVEPRVRRPGQAVAAAVVHAAPGAFEGVRPPPADRPEPPPRLGGSARRAAPDDALAQPPPRTDGRLRRSRGLWPFWVSSVVRDDRLALMALNLLLLCI